MTLRLGLIVNPIAGIGGPLALKGSDGVAEQVLAQGAVCRAGQRLQQCLELLLPYKDKLAWLSAPGKMGADFLENNHFSFTTIGEISHQTTTADDTERLVKQLLQHRIDILLFVGGDGTARNMVNMVGPQQLVLGIPAGVKMHSGVFAISPQAAGRLLLEFIRNKPVSVALQEVRDIDEQLLREGKVNSRYYGELLVPNDNRYVQQVKNSGKNDESMLQMEIAAGIVDSMDNETLYVIGAGTTPQAIMNELGLPNTLLGVDVVLGRQLMSADVTAETLLRILDQYPYHPAHLLLTATGGQGYIIGRGNQQLSPEFLRKVGRESLQLLITPDKLQTLSGRPLLMDSGDSELDELWSGWVPVVTGYQQTSVYPLNINSH